MLVLIYCNLYAKPLRRALTDGNTAGVDAQSPWQSLQHALRDRDAPASAWPDCEQWVRAWWPTVVDAPGFAALDLETVLPVVRQLVCGKVVETGFSPQLPLLLPAALCHVAQGRPAWLIMWRHQDLSSWRPLIRSIETDLGMKIGVFLNPGHNLRPEDVQDKDLILTHFTHLVRAWQRHPQLVQPERRPVAFFTELDISLLNRRLSLFRDGHLMGFAATSSPDPVQQLKLPGSEEEADCLDVREHLSGFTSVGGTTATMGCMSRQLHALYDLSVARLSTGERAERLPSLVFGDDDSRAQALYDDSSARAGRVLILAQNESDIESLAGDLNARGLAANLFLERSALIDFITGAGSQVGVASWMHLLDVSGCNGSANLNIFICGYPLENHQARIGLLQTQAGGSAPTLYLSATDAWVQEYTSTESLQAILRVVTSLERAYNSRWPRKYWSRILIWHLRRHWQRVERTMLTAMAPPEEALVTAVSVAEKLDALCFCGSGRTFMACHGGGLQEKGS